MVPLGALFVSFRRIALARRLTALVAVPILATSSLAVLPIQSLVYAAGTYQVSGTVTNQSGQGVGNVSVYVTSPGTTTMLFGPVQTDSSGIYSLGVDAGTYDLHFDPASGSGLNPIIDANYVVASSQALSVQLFVVPPSTPTHVISGHVLDGGGSPLSRLYVYFYDNKGNNVAGAITDANGYYSASGAPLGQFTVQISSGANGYGDPSWANAPSGIYLKSLVPVVDTSTADVIQDFRLPPTSRVTINVNDSNGNTVSSFGITSANAGGSVAIAQGSPALFATTFDYSNKSHPSGTYLMDVPNGTTFSAGQLCASASINNTAVRACLAQDLTVSGPTIQTITVPVPPATYTVSGYVYDGNGNPINGLSVGLFDTSGKNVSGGRTNASGYYSAVGVPLGQYSAAITTGATGYSDPNWANAPGSIYFKTTTPVVSVAGSDVSQNFQLPPMSRVTINVNDSNGNTVSNFGMTSANAGGSVALAQGSSALFSGSLDYSNKSHPSGTYLMDVPNGMTFSAGQLCAFTTINNTGVRACLAQDLTVNGPTTQTITVPVPPVTRTISGHIYDGSGNPINRLYVSFYDSKGNSVTGGITDANGYYSAPGAPLGQFTVRIGTGANGYSDPSWVNAPVAINFSSISSVVDTTAADVVQDFRLPATSRVTVYVQDTNNNPITSFSMMTATAGGQLSLAPGSPALFNVSADYSNKSHPSGTYLMDVPNGMTFSAGQLCAVTSINNTSVKACIAQDLTVTGAATLILQAVGPVPVAPNLDQPPSPFQLPVTLSWNAVSGATSYNIYRDGNKLDTSTTNSYSDTTASAGIHTYNVTAVNGAGESAPSNTVTVTVVTNQPPQVAALTPATISAGDAFNQNGTFTDPDSTSWTATVDYGDGSGVQPLPLAGNSFALGHVYAALGTYPVTVSITDNQGATGTATTTVTVIDTSAPTVTGNPDRTPDHGVWYNKDVTINWSVADPDSTATVPAPTVVSNDGANQTITSGQSCDPSSNCAPGTYGPVNLDKTPPTINYRLTPATTTGWNNGPVTVTFDCADATSGIASCTPPQTVSAEGVYIISGTAIDNAGNETSMNVTVGVDTTLPTITAVVSPAPTNPAGWNTTAPVTVTFTCSDSSTSGSASGVASCTNDGQSAANNLPGTTSGTMTSTATYTADGTYTVNGTVMDVAGNSRTIPVPVKVDTAGPVLGMPTWTLNPKTTADTTTLTVPATDGVSGIAKAEYFIGDTDPGQGQGATMALSNQQTNANGAVTSANLTTSFGTNFTPGVYKISVRAQDAAGNWSDVAVDYLTVYDASGPTDIAASKNKKPNSNDGDVLPGMAQAGNGDHASLGYDISKTAAGTIVGTSKLSLIFDVGNACKQKPDNCISTTFDATNGITALQWSGQNNSTGIATGTGILVVNTNGQVATTTNPFKVVGIDGNRTTPISADSTVLYIFPAGTDPNVANPESAALYKLHIAVSGDWVAIK